MSPNDGTPMPRGTFLVVHSDFVIAVDLAETIKDFNPSAQVIVKSHLRDACEALIFTESVIVAFVEAGPAEFAASPLARDIAYRGGRVVLVGHSAESAGETAEWPVLFGPFSSDDICSHLNGRVRC